MPFPIFLDVVTQHDVHPHEVLGTKAKEDIPSIGKTFRVKSSASGLAASLRMKPTTSTPAPSADSRSISVTWARSYTMK